MGVDSRVGCGKDYDEEDLAATGRVRVEGA